MRNTTDPVEFGVLASIALAALLLAAPDNALAGAYCAEPGTRFQHTGKAEVAQGAPEYLTKKLKPVELPEGKDAWVVQIVTATS